MRRETTGQQGKPRVFRDNTSCSAAAGIERQRQAARASRRAVGFRRNAIPYERAVRVGGEATRDEDGVQRCIKLLKKLLKHEWVRIPFPTLFFYRNKFYGLNPERILRARVYHLYNGCYSEFSFLTSLYIMDTMSLTEICNLVNKLIA
jgi:hypothetical protein